MSKPIDDALRILIVEDEMLQVMQLEMILEEQGHMVVGTANSRIQALALAARAEADLALVDINLADGPTGIDIGHDLATRHTMAVVFLTANPKRIPEDFSGAIGVIPKPYTSHGFTTALNYLIDAIRRPPADRPCPSSLIVPPRFEHDRTLGRR